MNGVLEKKAVLERRDFQELLAALKDQDYQVMGPTAQGGAIALDELHSVDDLPRGWTDEQEGGTYRLKRGEDEALFSYAVGPHSWKKFLHPAKRRLFAGQREDSSFQFQQETAEAPRYAFLGVRSCDIHAMAVLDKVFRPGGYYDLTYEGRRGTAFIVAVNCGHAGGTCFCVSMQTGPKAEFGFDLALTEVLEEGRHYFVVETGTERGAEVLGRLPHEPASAREQQAAERIIAQTARHMGRTMDTTDIKGLLYRNFEHPRWDNVAGRCLTCTNCTMVCPTCFCNTVEDLTGLSGAAAERWRKWDSCFTLAFTYIHGGSVRTTPRSRYRQWMTHKLATWIDQFGVSGCIGCGRCITWCPVAIDITEEVRAIRESESPQR